MGVRNRLDRLERALGGGDGWQPIAACADPARCGHASHFTFRITFPDGEVEEEVFSGRLGPGRGRAEDPWPA